jgi:hypothetical protein
MKSKTLKVELEIEISIDKSNPIVHEYESENDMVMDVLSYLSIPAILPVVSTGGVKVTNIEINEVQ